jgi:hypothetical protein
MFRLSATAFVLVCGLTCRLAAADDPRALVERAVRAVGGREALEAQVATAMRVKGKIHNQGQVSLEVEGSVLGDPGGRSRFQLRFDLNGTKHDAVIVQAGADSWRSVDGEVTVFSPAEVKALEGSAYRERVVGLVALLRDKRFTLLPLGEVKVQGHQALGVKVSHPGEKDISLYFDRESGYLVKYGYRGTDSGDDRDALRESELTDYREPVLGGAEERALRALKVDVTTPELLKFLRRLAPQAGHLEKARALVRQLGDDSFEKREKATENLIALGVAALPVLQEAAKSQDREVARRAEQCLGKIGTKPEDRRPILVVRLLAVRRPAGAVEALLDTLAGADAEFAREIKASLFALAHSGVSENQLLLKALTDKDAGRRAAAAAVLGKDGGAYFKEPRRRLYTGFPKQAARTMQYVDGKLSMELEASEWEFFNRFEDRDFTKP